MKTESEKSVELDILASEYELFLKSLGSEFYKERWFEIVHKRVLKQAVEMSKKFAGDRLALLGKLGSTFARHMIIRYPYEYSQKAGNFWLNGKTYYRIGEIYEARLEDYIEKFRQGLIVYLLEIADTSSESKTVATQESEDKFAKERSIVSQAAKSASETKDSEP